MPRRRPLFRVETPVEPFRLYRLVRSEAPTPQDFLSNAASGRRRRIKLSEDGATYVGLSAFDDHDVALAMARHAGGSRPFTHLATFNLTTESLAAIADTRSPGHWTVWAEPDLLCGAVIDVVPVALER